MKRIITLLSAAFVAGMLHRLDDDDQQLLNYALAAATLKNTITGDFNLATDDEIQAII